MHGVPPDLIGLINSYAEAADAAAPLWIFMLHAQGVLAEYWYVFVGLAFVQVMLTAWMIFEIMRDFRGGNRVAWLMVIGIPFLGFVLYVTLGLKEREEIASRA